MCSDMLDVEAPVLGVALGLTHTLAINAKSQLYSWGLNSYGQCGRTQTGDACAAYDRKARVTVPGSEVRIKQLGCGSTHSVVLDYDGNVYSWGNNQHGQLGNG